MSSTINQSAESCVANGLTFNLEDVDISAPKLNKQGGKSANVIYKPTKKGLYVNLQVPMLTWGATPFKDLQSGKETFDMAIQFPRKDYSTPETDILLAKFQALENKIKTEAVKNSMAWFNKKTMTPEVVEALWTPMLKYSKDPQTGEADLTKAPTLKVKLPCWDGKFNCEIYGPDDKMLYPDEHSDVTPIELIPKGVNVETILQCGGLWFANGKFGCTWRLFQAKVQPKPSMKGRCLFASAQQPQAPASTASAQQVSAQQVSAQQPQVSASAKQAQQFNSLSVEDDSDQEEPVTPAVPELPEVHLPAAVQPAAVIAQVAAVIPAAELPVLETKVPKVIKKVVRKA
jgi:hypothetical protein